MVKKFCDCCGREIDKKTAPSGSSSSVTRLGGAYPLPTVEGHPARVMLIEVTTGIDSTYNAGEFCKYCVIDAVKSFDDRPAPDA